MYDVKVEMRLIEDTTASQIYDILFEHQVNSLDLLSGKLDSSLQVMLEQDIGLFPSFNEISVQCNCMDDADICLHGAAVLYAVGIIFDKEPDQFLSLRGVRLEQLRSSAVQSFSHDDLDLEKANQLFDINFLS